MPVQAYTAKTSPQEMWGDSGHLLLSYRKKDRKIIVDPEDHDKFESSINEAIAACKDYKNNLQFSRQYDRLMMNVLPEWIERNHEKIKYAIVTMQDSRLLFLVIRNKKKHDPELESALIKLDLEITRDNELNLIRLSVLDLPDCSLDAIKGFLDCNYNWWYQHASQRRAPEARRQV